MISFVSNYFVQGDYMTRSLDETAYNRQTDTEKQINNSANDLRHI